MRLCTLPNEVTLLVLSGLELGDQFQLSLTCQHFQFIIRSDAICRMTLRERARFSPEFQEAEKTGEYARAWRCFVKRRIAVQTATPLQFSVVAVGTDFMLINGALIYKSGPSKVRVLVLNPCSDEEVQINTQRLAFETHPDFPTLSSEPTISALHYAEGIVTFLCEGERDFRLIPWDLKHRAVIYAHRIEKGESLFVRNTSAYICYGIRKFLPGRRWEWIIRAYDLWRREPIWERRLGPDFTGSELGRNACFEIFDGYLYGVSSTSSSPPTDSTNSWNSFYHVFRFQIDRPSPIQVLPKPLSWRRHWREGSVDTRYSDLRLAQDEATGSLFIYETRREFTATGHTERNCYRKEICFPDLQDDLRVKACDHETHVEIRRAEDVHTGDSGLNLYESDPRSLCAHSYNTAARAFMDIVKDPSTSELDQQRLRLRIRPMVQYAEEKCSNRPLRGEGPDNGSKVRFWPPEPTPEQHNPTLDLIHSLMNPTGEPIEKLRCAADDRFLIYSPIKDRQQATPLVLVSFDPALRLDGLRKIDGSAQDPIPQDLLKTTPWPEPTDFRDLSRDQPFHRTIKGPDCQRYGFDLTH